MVDLPILRITMQRTKSDCAVAVLAMLLGFVYEEVLIVTSRVHPTILTEGMTTRQIRTIARRLGYSCTRKRDIDLLADTGALTIASKQFTFDHLVVLREGLIVETDGTLWDTDIFMKAYEAVPTHLLVFEKLEGE